MPTKALETILYRELSVAEARDRIEVASPLLQELVNYSTNALARFDRAASGEENEDVAALALYLHVVEMTDGIEVLVAQSCLVPAIPLLRSSFEAMLHIQYILEDESQYVRRSLSWLAAYAHDRIASYETLDPSTSKGSEYAKVASQDEAAKAVTLPDRQSIQNAISNLRQLLSREQFKPIEAEFMAERKKQKRRSAWHSLFNGPRSLQQLAIHLDRGAQYEILYRHWSRVSHANDFSRLLAVTSDGQRVYRRLRDPARFDDVMKFAPTLLLQATRLMIGRFRVGELESLSRWYKEEVQSNYRKVTFESAEPR